jgi:hypothetical protein
MVPSPIKQRGTSLESQHLADVVFSLTDSLELIDALRDTGVVILGGDFWSQDNYGKFKPVYENWYIERRDGESSRSYIDRSISRAREEVAKRTSKNYFVSLTCRIVG